MTTLVKIYSSRSGQEPYSNWINGLKDKKTIIRIKDRINRISEFNSFGDYKHLDEGIYEIKFHFGAGYRVYFIFSSKNEIILLNGGDKSSQVKDIKKTNEYLEDMRND